MPSRIAVLATALLVSAPARLPWTCDAFAPSLPWSSRPTATSRTDSTATSVRTRARSRAWRVSLVKLDELEGTLVNDDANGSSNPIEASSLPPAAAPSSTQQQEEALLFADSPLPPAIMTEIESSFAQDTTDLIQLADAAAYESNKKDKLVMLGLLWITAFLSALDRVAMSVALVPMTTEFGLTDTIKGSISSFFSIGYGLGILPAGILLSFASPRIVMSVAIVAWSLATLATPWAAEGLAVGSTTTALLLTRACVGAAESLVMPTIQRLLLAWTTAQEKAVGIATVFTGFQSGTIAAYLLSPIVMDRFADDANNVDGWRELFTVYGAFGLALLVPWLLVAKDGPSPTSSSNLRLAPIVTTESPTASTESSTEKDNPWDTALQVFREAPWRDFAQSKGTWGMLLAHSAKNWGLYNSLAWTPTFYAEEYGIGVRDSAWLSVMPAVAGAVGGLVAGNLADAVLRRQQEANGGILDEKQLTNIRKTFQAIALYGPALALGALAWDIPKDPVVAQSFLMASVGLQAFTAAGFESGNQEKAGPRWAGLLYSVTSLPSVMVGTFGVYCVGQVLDATGQDWSLVFGLNAFVNVLGATAFVVLYNSKREFD